MLLTRMHWAATATYSPALPFLSAPADNDTARMVSKVQPIGDNAWISIRQVGITMLFLQALVPRSVQGLLVQDLGHRTAKCLPT